MSELIYGKIPVMNAIKSNRNKERIYISNNIKSDDEIFLLANKNKVKYEVVNNDFLNKLCNGKNHQGVAIKLDDYHFTDFNALIKSLAIKSDSTIIILDQILDPVNLGSIIRTAAAFQIDGIILGKNRQVQITSTVSKVSTGAEEYIPIVQVTNIAQTIEILKKHKFWIISTSGNATQEYDNIDYKGNIAIVIGNEGKGISRLVLDRSDIVCKIPLNGPVQALNASIATAIMLAQIDSYRRKN